MASVIRMFVRKAHRLSICVTILLAVLFDRHFDKDGIGNLFEEQWGKLYPSHLSRTVQSQLKHCPG